MDADSGSVPGLKIDRASAEYEEWISRHLRLLGPDLVLKHQQMRSAPFPFLRATYYRWAQVWTEAAPRQPGRRWSSPSVTCMSRTSVPGGIAKAA